MSTVEFKSACAAHRKCCPYKATGMTWRSVPSPSAAATA